MAVDTNKQTIIDSHFFVPKGVVDVRQANDDDYAATYTADDTAQDPPILDTPTAAVPMPPTSYQIVDQYVRISADGTAVVDVTIEFPDVAGINTIDVRVTKAV